MITINLRNTTLRVLGFEFSDTYPEPIECSAENVWAVSDRNHGRAPTKAVALDETGRRFWFWVRGRYNGMGPLAEIHGGNSSPFVVCKRDPDEDDPDVNDGEDWTRAHRRHVRPGMWGKFGRVAPA